MLNEDLCISLINIDLVASLGYTFLGKTFCDDSKKMFDRVSQHINLSSIIVLKSSPWGDSDRWDAFVITFLKADKD